MNNPKGLDEQIDKYFSLAEKNNILKKTFAKNVLEIQSIDLIQDPRNILQRICKFLQLQCESKYLDDCAGIVYEEPSKSRFSVVWTEEQKRKVYLKIEKFKFLNNYSFDS